MLEELMEKIKNLEENMQLLLELHLQQTNNLTTYNDVAKFLDVSVKTIRNYIDDGRFKQDIHYYVNSENKKVFIPNGVIELKKGVKAVGTSTILKKADEVTSERINNDIVSSILEGVA